MSGEGEKLEPCPHCAADLYSSDIEGGVRWAHPANGCINSRRFIRGPEAISLWNRRASGWQPIESAPKDGSRYLVYVPRTPTPDNATTFDVYEACYVGGYDSGDLWFSKGKDIRNPTHWMPTPTPQGEG